MFKRSVLIAVCLLGVGMSAQAASAERAKPFKLAFSFDRTAAAETTYAQLVGAARKACNPDDIRTVEATDRRDACVARVVDQAIARIDMAALTSVHMAAAGKPARVLLAQN